MLRKGTLLGCKTNITVSIYKTQNQLCNLLQNTITVLGSLGTVVGCQHSVVRLVSSGNYYNTVTFSYRPPMQEELSMSSGVC